MNYILCTRPVRKGGGCFAFPIYACSKSLTSRGWSYRIKMKFTLVIRGGEV